MKKSSFGLPVLLSIIAITACNNNGSNTGNTDSTTTSTTTVTTSHNYAARADSINRNSQAGYYLNPRTGKAITIRMDTATGVITDETGAPVRRFVDKRTWYVYDASSGDTLGSAQMNNGNLMYRGQNGDWEPYEKRWTDDTTSVSTSTTTDSNMESSSGTSGSTTSGRETKIKVKEHGGKVKTVEKTKE